MAYARIFQKLLQNFFLTMGRAPITPMEWTKLRRQAMELARKEGGDPITGLPSISSKTTIQDLMTGPHISQGGPKGDRIWDFSKDIPTIDVQSRTADIIPFPKGRRTSEGVMGLMKKGDVQLGKAPKTLQSTLDQKKAAHEGHINKEMWQKQKRQENKEAIERFKEKMAESDKQKKYESLVKAEEDKMAADEDYLPDIIDPEEFSQGGIAPLVGEPSYAADFYDDRTPMKKGRKVKKKKLTAAEKRKREEEEHKEIIKEMIKKMPRYMWRMRPSGKQRYKKKSDLPEGILEILEKDPGFDFEDFAKIYWSPEGAQWTDEGFSRGQLGSYSDMTGDIELGLAPFGKKKYKEWELGKPHLDPKALTDRDKATIALHELRHKNILENRELFEAQPEWVKSIEGPGYLPEGGTTGHELYDRFLDKRFNPTISDPGRHDPYFDKILRDYWEPYAQEYENIAGRLKSEKRGEGIETLAAQGGRIGLAGGSIVKGGRWFLNNLRRALNDIEADKGFKNLTPERKEGLTSEIKNLIKSVEGGGPIPDEMIQTIRNDPKFATISKTRSTDPDLYEFEDLILNYGKKGDVVDEQVQILEKFDPKDRLPNQSGGPVDQEALIQMYLAEGLSYEEAVQAAQSTTNLPWDTLKKAEGGIMREGHIFGGSVGLRAFLKRLMGTRKKAFPKSIDKEGNLITADWKQKMMPREFEREKELRILYLENLLKGLKHDKKTMEMIASNKSKKDAGLDFLTQQMEDMFAPNLKKYTDIDKDILNMEQMIANQLKKQGRKPHNLGGRVSYSGGGRAGLPAITYGMSHPEMQGPQMPAAPQPTGIPGANLQMNQMDLMQQKMQQNPWMQNNMRQGIGGMQNPQYKGQFRMPFGLGGINKGRRAFMKWLAGLTGAGIAGASGLLKFGKAAKVVPKVSETIVQSNAAGMPPWFPSLVKKVVDEGTDVTKQFGTVEREIVHATELPSGTKVLVTQQLDTGDVLVDIGMGKHGWKDGFHGQPTRLVLKKGEWIEPDISKSGKVTGKPKKTQDEFMVEEAEFTGGHPENVKFEESTIEKYGEHGSDFTEVEKYATGKTSKESKAQKQVWEADWDDSLPDYEDYASGGLAYALGE